jgi:hypothetical protein
LYTTAASRTTINNVRVRVIAGIGRCLTDRA